MTMTRDSAEVIGLRGLSWLAGHSELLTVFLGATGASESDFRERAQDPDFLAAVLDFILMDDAWVLKFGAANDIPGERVMLARAVLPGGEQVHWT